jgi:hypothetical protein
MLPTRSRLPATLDVANAETLPVFLACDGAIFGIERQS